MENRALTADEEKIYIVGGTATTSINAIVSKYVEAVVDQDDVISDILDVAMREQNNNGSVSMIGTGTIETTTTTGSGTTTTTNP